jgi:hypothetical protein
MNITTLSTKGALAAVVGLSMLVGATGATFLKVASAHAQTTTPAVSASPQNGSTQGTFKSNEDPAHEAKESAAWEAQEDAGQAPWQHQSGGTTQ